MLKKIKLMLPSMNIKNGAQIQDGSQKVLIQIYRWRKYSEKNYSEELTFGNITYAWQHFWFPAQSLQEHEKNNVF
jgi:hypothetical protein